MQTETARVTKVVLIGFVVSEFHFVSRKMIAAGYAAELVRLTAGPSIESGSNAQSKAIALISHSDLVILKIKYMRKFPSGYVFPCPVSKVNGSSGALRELFAYLDSLPR